MLITTESQKENIIKNSNRNYYSTTCLLAA